MLCGKCFFQESNKLIFQQSNQRILLECIPSPTPESFPKVCHQRQSLSLKTVLKPKSVSKLVPESFRWVVAAFTDIFDREAMTSGAAWEAGRTDEQRERRARNKAERSFAHHQNLRWQGPVPPRAPGPALVGQGCPGCDNLNHHALACRGEPKMCSKCCKWRGICLWHQMNEADLAKARLARPVARPVP
jgi:hypothetical protein